MELLRVEDAVRWCRAEERLVLFHGLAGLRGCHGRTLAPAIQGVVSETSALRGNSVEVQLWHCDAESEYRSRAADENEFSAEPVETVAHLRHDRGGNPRTV